VSFGITDKKINMKYIIRESKINKLVSMYMDNQKLYTLDIGDGEFNIIDEEFGEDFIRYRNQYSSTVPDHMFDLIYVEDMFVTRLSKLFGLEVRDVIPLVINWFNKTYDKNLNNNDWEWMETDHEEEDF
jgi:hypothetical protein